MNESNWPKVEFALVTRCEQCKRERIVYTTEKTITRANVNIDHEFECTETKTSLKIEHITKLQ